MALLLDRTGPVDLVATGLVGHDMDKAGPDHPEPEHGFVRFDLDRGDTDMAAATASLRVTSRTRPRSVDLLVMRVSLAMLLWARRRANRNAMSREENLRRREVAAATELREHAAARRIDRAF